MAEWITDRQPTEADADINGAVLLKRFTDGRKDKVAGVVDAFVDWHHIGPGIPWRHTDAREEPSKPKPKLAVGQTWRTRSGKLVEIVGATPESSPFASTHPFKGVLEGRPKGDWHSYTPYGRFAVNQRDHALDLIELVSEAPPEQRPRLFVSFSGYVDSTGTHYQLAVADDGTAWCRHTGGPWVQQPSLPGREVADHG